MSEPFVGEIRMAGFNFAPRGWAFCNGQLLPISQNNALFALLGTTYGGDGRTTFGLPDLRGRAPIHWGQGPSLTTRVIGEIGGNETHTLLSTEMPMHTHLVSGLSTPGTALTPGGNILAGQARGGAALYGTGTADSTLAASAVATAGGSQPHNNMQPFVTVTFIIALNGIFPSRN